MSASLSTHVLDAALGQPAVGLPVTLNHPATPAPLAEAVTDDDGRIAWAVSLDPGTYELRFATGPWFHAADRDTFFPAVALTVDLAAGHSHVALLLSPYSYTTYKGS